MTAVHYDGSCLRGNYISKIVEQYGKIMPETHGFYIYNFNYTYILQFFALKVNVKKMVFYTIYRTVLVSLHI